MRVVRPNLQFSLMRRQLRQWLRRFESLWYLLSSRYLQRLCLAILLQQLGCCLRFEERHQWRWLLSSCLGFLYSFLVIKHLMVELVGVHLDSFFLIFVSLERRCVAQCLKKFLDSNHRLVHMYSDSPILCTGTHGLSGKASCKPRVCFRAHRHARP